jgi:hypothetical protein
MYRLAHGLTFKGQKNGYELWKMPLPTFDGTTMVFSLGGCDISAERNILLVNMTK